MQWSELVKKSQELGGDVLDVGYENYTATLSERDKKIEAIKFLTSRGNIYFIKDGDIFFLPEYKKDFIKIGHIPVDYYDKMFMIMEALR